MLSREIISLIEVLCGFITGFLAGMFVSKIIK